MSDRLKFHFLKELRGRLLPPQAEIRRNFPDLPQQLVTYLTRVLLFLPLRAPFCKRIIYRAYKTSESEPVQTLSVTPMRLYHIAFSACNRRLHFPLISRFNLEIEVPLQKVRNKLAPPATSKMYHYRIRRATRTSQFVFCGSESVRPGTSFERKRRETRQMSRLKSPSRPSRFLVEPDSCKIPVIPIYAIGYMPKKARLIDRHGRNRNAQVPGEMYSSIWTHAPDGEMSSRTPSVVRHSSSPSSHSTLTRSAHKNLPSNRRSFMHLISAHSRGGFSLTPDLRLSRPALYPKRWPILACLVAR